MPTCFFFSPFYLRQPTLAPNFHSYLFISFFFLMFRVCLLGHDKYSQWSQVHKNIYRHNNKIEISLYEEKKKAGNKCFYLNLIKFKCYCGI